MKKFSIAFLCLTIILSFSACTSNVKLIETENKTTESTDVMFTKTENKSIISTDGTEYVFVGIEDKVWCFGEREYIGHIDGEKMSFVHLTHKIKTGMYSVNGRNDVLVRYFPNSEFASIYANSDLLKTDVVLDNCIRFEFVKASLFDDDKTTISKNGITECERFLNEIRAGQNAKEAGLYDLVSRPDGSFENLYLFGYIYGVLQQDFNLIIPLEVWSFDDQAYSIRIDDKEYVLPQEWANKLITK